MATLHGKVTARARRCPERACVLTALAVMPFLPYFNDCRNHSSSGFHPFCPIYLLCIRYKTFTLLIRRIPLIPMLPQVFLAFIFILPSIQSGSPKDEGLLVHTAEGDILGTLITPTVRRFLGIPYAVANRWEAPQKPPIRNVPFNATKFGDSCPQGLALPPGGEQLVGPAGNLNAPESEDCLNVNIWAPSIRRKQGTAVMIWIYGGGFLFGTVRCMFPRCHDLIVFPE